MDRQAQARPHGVTTCRLASLPKNAMLTKAQEDMHCFLLDCRVPECLTRKLWTSSRCPPTSHVRKWSIQAAAASAKTSQTADVSAYSWDEDQEGSGLGPAAQSTLQVLEWPLLCSYVARFASTTLGSRAASTLHLPEAQVRPHTNPCLEQAADH